MIAFLFWLLDLLATMLFGIFLVLALLAVLAPFVLIGSIIFEKLNPWIGDDE